MPDHSLELDQDDGGWDIGTCTCGQWECPPVPGIDIVADAYAEHVVAARMDQLGWLDEQEEANDA